jgi:hypothetical protein
MPPTNEYLRVGHAFAFIPLYTLYFYIDRLGATAIKKIRHQCGEPQPPTPNIMSTTIPVYSQIFIDVISETSPHDRKRASSTVYFRDPE